MTSKTTANKWSDIHLAIAAISMTSVIAFWNMFAGPDRVKADEKALAEQQSAGMPTVTSAPEIVEVPVAATMPPTGYTILFGGKAPQPQVIVVAQPKKNNGGGNSGGGNGSSASQPTTSTGSS